MRAVRRKADLEKLANIKQKEEEGEKRGGLRTKMFPLQREEMRKGGLKRSCGL